MKANVIDTLGRPWEVREWHNLPVPAGVTPSAFLVRGQLKTAEDTKGEAPEGCTAWMVFDNERVIRGDFESHVELEPGLPALMSLSEERVLSTAS